MIELMKIIVDKNKCIGCNMCEDISEGAMGTKYGSDGKAGINPETNLEEKKVIEDVKLAAETCPMRAVTFEADQ